MNSVHVYNTVQNMTNNLHVRVWKFQWISENLIMWFPGHTTASNDTQAENPSGLSILPTSPQFLRLNLHNGRERAGEWLPMRMRMSAYSSHEDSLALLTASLSLGK